LPPDELLLVEVGFGIVHGGPLCDLHDLNLLWPVS
jgi:hypothetical protein